MGTLIQQLAGDAGVSWLWDPREHHLNRETVSVWWKAAQTKSEEEYLVQSVIPRLPQATRTYTAMVERLIRKYPQRLREVYRRRLAERPELRSGELLQAILAADLPRSEKMDVLIEGTVQQKVARQTEALEMIAGLDQHTFEQYLIRSLKALPLTTENRYSECEQVGLAQLCWKTNSLNVWHLLRDVTQKSDVSVRMEIICQITDASSLSWVRERRVAEFLLSFLEDTTVRDITAAPHKYAGGAAENRPQIEVRNWAAYRLAIWFDLDVSTYGAEQSVTSEDWQRLRSQLSDVCKERRISADDPSPDEIRLAQKALQEAGVLLLDVDDPTELRHITVNLANEKIKDADLRHLHYLYGIAEVNLAGASITDEGLKEIGKCRYVRVLNLSRTRITDAGLEHLKELVGLERVDLSRTSVTDAGLEKLAGLIHVEHLDLSDTMVSDAGLPVLSKLVSLELLSLRGTAISNAGLSHLKTIPRLVSLDLSGTNVSDAGMQYIAECAGLISLTLSLTKVTDAGLPCLSKLSKLRRAYLAGLPITDRGVSDIAQLHALTTLSLTGTDITDDGTTYLTQLQDVANLYLSQTSLTDRGVRAFKSLKNLVLLDLSGTKITDRVFDSLRSMTKLKCVMIYNTRLTRDAKETLLRGSPNLEIRE